LSSSDTTVNQQNESLCNLAQQCRAGSGAHLRTLAFDPSLVLF
jgi:hypothetical protein